MIGRLLSAIVGRAPEEQAPEPPETVIPVRFQWRSHDGNTCFVQKSMHPGMVSRKGDRAHILCMNLNLEGRVAEVRWTVFDQAEPGWEPVTDEEGPSSYTRARARVRLTMEEIRWSPREERP